MASAWKYFVLSEFLTRGLATADVIENLAKFSTGYVIIDNVPSKTHDSLQGVLSK